MLLSLLRNEKARLTIHKPEGAGLGAPEGAPIIFQFNPANLAITKTSNWTPPTADRNAPHTGTAQFTGPEAATLSLEMLLDSTVPPEPDISEIVTKLSKCLVAHPSTDKKHPTPPFLRFTWGMWKWGNGHSSFDGYVTSVATTYQLFNGTGEPIRAKITIALKEHKPRTGGQNPTSGTLVPQHSRTVRSGDTLASIAWEEYGDPTAWRALARANDIDDPLRLRPGTALLVPLQEDLGNGADEA